MSIACHDGGTIGTSILYQPLSVIETDRDFTVGKVVCHSGERNSGLVKLCQMLSPGKYSCYLYSYSMGQRNSHGHATISLGSVTLSWLQVQRKAKHWQRVNVYQCIRQVGCEISGLLNSLITETNK